MTVSPSSDPAAPARRGAQLFLFFGLLALVVVRLPGGPPGVDRGLMQLLGLADIAVAALLSALPWRRWHPHATLVVVPLAFALIVGFQRAGALPPSLYAVVFAVVFLWAGMSYPPGTTVALAPLGALAYVLGLLGTHPAQEVLSVLMAIPVSVIAGELAARALASARRAEAALQRSSEQLHEAQRLARMGSWEWDVSSDRVEWSDELYRLLGFAPQELPPSLDTYLLRVHPEDHRKVRNVFGWARQTRNAFVFDHRVVLPDGEVRWLHCRGRIESDADGRPRRMAGTATDITVRTQREEAIGLLAAIVDSSDDAIIGTTITGEIISWNPAAERLYGYTAEEIIGEPIRLLVAEEFRERHEQVLDRLRRGERTKSFDAVGVHRDGSRVSVSLTVSPIHNSAGDVIGFAAIERDNTEQHALQDELRALALVDDLTGLHNRRGFTMLADQQLKQARRAGQSLTLYYVDLDRLKPINDTLGHREGDRALKETADLLRTVFRDSDIIARVGGDEFCVLPVDDDQRPPEDGIAKRLEVAVAARNAGGGRSYSLSLSMGSASYDPADPCSIDELLARADASMYAAKHAKRQRPHLLVVDDDPVMADLTRALFPDWDVVAVGLGEAALRQVFIRTPDVILLDLELPDINGLDLLNRLRDCGPARLAPVMVFTASSVADAEWESLRAGVADFAVKPVDPKVLRARVENLLRRHPSVAHAGKAPLA